MVQNCPVRCSLDLVSPGKRTGFIDVTLSNDALAFSTIRVPIGVLCGAAGPTVLLTAGNHGDEYEGQLILHRMLRELEPEQLNGRIIALPALNAPAVRARTRVSPLDQGNMNRAFPGTHAPGPTAAIARFVSHELIPQSDIILDFHSGGTATRYIDCAFVCLGNDAALNADNIDLARQFGADFTMVSRTSDEGADFDSEAYRQGKKFLSCELGGMGTMTTRSFQIGWSGCCRVLSNLGLFAVDEVMTEPADAAMTRFVDVGADCSHVTSNFEGLIDLHVQLGDEVGKGQVVATLYDIHNIGHPPASLTTQQNGVVCVTRRNPLVSPGDHLLMICGDYAI